jgi:hypothetical protein
MIPFFDPKHVNWYARQTLHNFSFVCGYCNNKVSSDRGYKIGSNHDGSGTQLGGVFICPNCLGPTFHSPNGEIFPSYSIGNSVEHVPKELNDLYEEARRCTSHNCFTACVLLCRKMLMNIAVVQGAKEGLKFIEYVNYLSNNGYTPPNGKHWVDHIRKKGNEANHEISLMNENDAKELLVFTEMLLKFIYEFPAIINQDTE